MGQVKTALEASEKMVKAALEKESAEKQQKKSKRRIQIEEVDSSTEVPKKEEAPKKAKKKIQIEEVDSSAEAPKEEPKKAKKKIQIEEVDSSAPKEEVPKKTKKKIQIEEVDSTPTVQAPPPKVSSPVGAERAIPASLKRAKPAPKTGYEFERNLEGCKTPEAAAAYMSLVQAKEVKKLLKQNLTPELLMQIIDGLGAGLEGGAEASFKWSSVLPKVNRFDIIVDFMSADEKQKVSTVVDQLVAGGVSDAKAVSGVKTAFKL